MSKCPYWALLGLKEPYWGLTRPYFEFEDEQTNRHTTYVIRTIRVRQIFRHKYLSQTFQFIFCSSPGSHSWKEHGMVMLWCDAMFMSWQAQLAAGELSSSGHQKGSAPLMLAPSDKSGFSKMEFCVNWRRFRFQLTMERYSSHFRYYTTARGQHSSFEFCLRIKLNICEQFYWIWTSNKDSSS